MANLDIVQQRMHTHFLIQRGFETPSDVVRWLCAVQAQDYLASLWALGLRLPNSTEAEVEQAIAEKTMVRTWPMRGTVHFVTPEDARWMLKLLTPRVIARSARMYRQLDLDERTFARSTELLASALQGGKQLTRRELYQVLERGNVPTAGMRGGHILGRLAQAGLICGGARQGKQQTFVLLEEWAPTAKMLEREEALAELARRYFTSHGPATLQDFAWWTGLIAADAKTALELAKSELVEEVIDGRAYWLSPSIPAAKVESPTVHLLPSFDEYTVAYTDRSAFLDPVYTEQTAYGIGPVIVLDGRVVGAWKRTFRKGAVVVEPTLFAPLTAAETDALAAAAHRYGEFLGMPVALP